MDVASRAKSLVSISRATALAAAAGLALLSYGTVTHVSVAGRARCDGCAPWHPLFVLAPLVAGAALLAAGVALAARG